MKLTDNEKHMIIAILLALILASGIMIYIGGINYKPPDKPAVQYLQMEQHSSTDHMDLPPVVYNSTLDVWLDGRSITQAPTIDGGTPIRPFYFDAVKTVIEMLYGINNPWTLERNVSVNQTGD